MNVLRIDDKEFWGASEWSELTGEQVRKIFAIDFMKPLHIVRLSLVAVIYELKLKRLLAINERELPKLDALFEFVLKEEKLFKNPLPVLRMRGLELYGPADNLENLTFGEWIFLDAYFTRYYQRKEPADLDMLIAVLWRESKRPQEMALPDYNNDRRVIFNKYLVERRLPIAKHLPPADKKSILHFVSSARQLVVMRNPEVFMEPKAAGVAATGTGAAWIDVLLTIAGGKFGTVQQTEEAMLTEVMFELKRMMKK